MQYSDITLGKPVSVRVKGQSKRLTPVTLVAIDGDTEGVQVRTGKRGRPSRLPVDRITEIRVLKGA